LPPPAKNLFHIAEFKQTAAMLGIRKIDVGPGGGSASFEQETQIDPASLIRYVQQNPKTHRLEGGVKLRFILNLEADEKRFEFAQALLDALSKKAPAPTASPSRSKK
jgi:transcription-repair coupling factor (superfamily II helicase)